MLDDIKVKDLLNLIELFNNKKVNNDFWEVGKAYFIRTVTMHHIGKLKEINDKELLLVDAVWVADSGRFHDALKKGELNEIEPFVNPVIINRDCIIDATIWDHAIPRDQK